MGREGLCLINGERAGSIDALDRGLQYGDGVFRTLRVVGGRIRWWADQIRKLEEDCAALSIPCPSREVLKAEVDEIAAEPTVGVVKLIITRGSGRRGYAMPLNPETVRIVLGFPPVGGEDCDVRVRWCKLRLSSQPRLAGIKHLNRLENVLARSEWNDPSIAEGLLRDGSGRVICGTMSNLFLVERGKLVTPDVSRCGVAGVARSRILRAVARHGLPAETGPISPARLLSSDGVFLCNSLVGVWRVAKLDDKRWPDDGWAEKLRSLLYEET